MSPSFVSVLLALPLPTWETDSGGELVSIAAASFLDGLRLHSPALDLLRRDAVFFHLLLLLRWCGSCPPGWICFLCLQICFLFLAGSSSSCTCAAPLLRWPPRGEFDPQSPLSLDGDDARVCYRSCSSLFVRLFSVQAAVSWWIRVSFVMELMLVVTVACCTLWCPTRLLSILHLMCFMVLMVAWIALYFFLTVDDVVLMHFGGMLLHATMLSMLL